MKGRDFVSSEQFSFPTSGSNFSGPSGNGDAFQVQLWGKGRKLPV